MPDRWRLSSTARAGLLLLSVSIAAFACIYFWVSTRTFVPVDVPISLAPGHIQTGDFNINLEANFSIYFQSPPSASFACYSATGLKTRRLTSISGTPVFQPDDWRRQEGGIIRGTYLGTFYAKPGRYQLDIEVVSQTQSLDACHPSLEIAVSNADWSDRENNVGHAVMLCLFGAFLGFSALVMAIASRFGKLSLDETSLKIFERGAAPSSRPRQFPPKRPIAFLLVLGLLTFVAGAIAFISSARWYDAQRFSVLDTPVSLRRGHVLTDDFTISIKGKYDISIDEQLPAPYGSPSNCDPYTVLKTHWHLMQAGPLVAHIESPDDYWRPSGTPSQGPNLYGLSADPGTYRLDIEVLSDARCLDSRCPRLRVSLSSEDRDDYDDLLRSLQHISLIPFAVGLMLLVAYALGRRRPTAQRIRFVDSLPNQLMCWGSTGLCHRGGRKPFARPLSRTINVPLISLTCVLTVFTVAAPMWLIHSRVRVSQGLFVAMAPRAASPKPAELSLTAPLISIDNRGRLYLNYKPTTWKDLPIALDIELTGLPVRVAYVDGANEILFQEVARVIDIIEGAHATPILMTPGSKATHRD